MRLLTITAAAIVFAIATSVMLGFPGQTVTANPSPAQLPFPNSVEQRIEMISELRNIRELLKQQNQLLLQQNSYLKEQLELLRSRLRDSTHGHHDDQNGSANPSQP